MLFAAYLSAFALLCLAGCGDSMTLHATQSSQIGGKMPVRATALIGQQTSQRTGQHGYQFRWKFDVENFEITGDSIPEDLLKDLCNGQPVEEIVGTWKIENDHIILTTEANGETKNCQMEIFSTGPIRIQSTAAQYVF